jgi:hypothetical protein
VRCDAVQTGCLLAGVSKEPDIIMTAYFAPVMAKAVLTVPLVSTRLHDVTPAKIVMLVS